MSAIVALFVLILACGCVYSQTNSPAGSSWPTTQDDLQSKIGAAENGDVEAMNFLFLYYSLEKSDDAEAFYWKVMAAEAGDETRKADVISTLESSPDYRQRGMAKYLKRKWSAR